jgi:Homeodomain-like domain-containing protein
VHGQGIREEALCLVAAGVNDCEIARRLGIPRSTVRDWRRPTYVPRGLEDWQQELIDQAPWAFLRGCIRSDGCAFINRTGPYEYLSYGFANLSVDILDLFEGTCLTLGLRPRRYATSIRLNRRDDAAQLFEHVGMKS